MRSSMVTLLIGTVGLLVENFNVLIRISEKSPEFVFR